MVYTDVHTHSGESCAQVIRIKNMHEHFEEMPAGGPVSVGLHPWWLQGAEENLAALQTAATAPGVIAIGECGLDKRAQTDWNLQVRFFKAQLQLAADLHKPLIIHCVKAFPEILSLLKGIGVPVIFHGVNNGLPAMAPVLDSGYYLSFGKSLLKPGDIIRTTFNAVPLSQLFLETDDSGVSVKNMYKSAAEIRNIDENEIALQLLKNFHSVFSYAGS
ncbi:TatD family hydrolase [Niabella sp. CC-SYL272]|uniref:TatD family hydrolase n=1 Tax=Niabella agricola TaxID=2891571 RepID=UPI001F2614B1|nr:TatD family hydrolase [Niabella agricola]MCF3110411.1 TatD family hydrolase [Niabella agricola]